ncbi:MAG: Fe2+-dependent dioxygenase [Gammaproteobacteria bacterium]
MLHWLDNVLESAELDALLGLIAHSEFVDGRETAGFRAKRVKHNQQLKKNPSQAEAINSKILDALQRHALFQAVAIPKRIHRPLISRYQVGMQYGKHVDDALMDKPNTLRTDLSLTIFLNDPASYDGGELVIDTALGEQAIKLPPGDAILYPSTTLHRVAEVTRGERLAAVTWIQSYVRDPNQREILFDLDKIRRQLDQQAPHGPETDLAYKVHTNLLRMWAEV